MPPDADLREVMLIVDDTPAKVQQNYGNTIYSKPYQGEAADEELQHLAAYLLLFKQAEGFRAIKKRHWRQRFGH